ncbi:MAG: diguanylate cyclase [Rubrivivax sp.]
MSDLAQPATDACDEALSLLIADGAAAARLAAGALRGAGSDAALAARAHAVLACYELREGTLEAGLRELQAARECLAQAPAHRRAAWLVEQTQSLALRREGRLAEAEALLLPLHARAAERSPTEAYLTAASLAIVQSMRGQDDAALDTFHQAVMLARLSGVDSLLVNALSNLGSFQTDLYNLEDARPMLEECLQGALRLGSRRQVVYAAGNLVQCLCLLGESEHALAVAREHLIPNERADDPAAMRRDEDIAHALLDNGLVDEAEARLGGPALADPLSNELDTVRVWLLARVRLARGDAAEALRLCQAQQSRLDAQAEASTVAADRVNLLRLTAQAARECGDHALACGLLEQAFAVHERLLGRAARARRISVQVAHRLRQAEWERDAARHLAARLETLNASLQAQVAENERLQARLRMQAIEDPLTGLPNRRHLFDAGAALLSLMQRRSEPVAAAIVDLDHFKQVNDLYGHDAGDQVLRAFAELVRHETRAGDVVCRYGGEEFVLLLPGAGPAGAAVRLQALLDRFTGLRFTDGEGRAFRCSFSAGVAAWDGEQERLESLLARADAALYAAKSAGRARVLQHDT